MSPATARQSLYHYHFEIAAVNAMASAMSTATATATAAATATVSSLIISSSGLAPRSLRFVFLFCYQTILSSHRSRYRLLPPPLLLRPQTKRLPADETPPLDHKGLFPFFISTDNSSRRSRSCLVLFHFSPQTKPRPAIGVADSLNAPPTPITCQGLVDETRGKGIG